MMNQPSRFVYGIDFGTDDTTVLFFTTREGRVVAPLAEGSAAGMRLLMENANRVLREVARLCADGVVRPLISMLYKRLPAARLVSARRARRLRRRGVLLTLAPPTSTGKARYRYFPLRKT